MSVGFDSWWFDDFVDVIKATRTTAVVDIRVSPSFNIRGFDVASVFASFREVGVEYRHIPELGNQFIGDDWNLNVTLIRYRNHLARYPELVSGLCEFVASQRGPVLLLGRTPDHEHSERSIIVDAMRHYLKGGVTCYRGEEILSSLRTGKLEA